MMRRRDLLLTTGTAALGLAISSRGARSQNPAQAPQVLEAHLLRAVDQTPIMGLSVCAFEGETVIYANAFGWADQQADRRRAVTSINNIGSVSKLFTATAFMQLVERGQAQLDADINTYLPFRVRHPGFPDVAITPRHILAHVSAMADGPWYGRNYACGDPTIPLEDWVPAMLTPAGRFWADGANFHPWRPERRFAYANLPWAALALIVQRIAGKPFVDVCRERIWSPLGMTRTSWFLSDLPREEMARPYTLYQDGVPWEVPWSDEPLIDERRDRSQPPPRDGFLPHCYYSFPNYPDGALRTSADQLARFVMAAAHGGTHRGARVLEEATQQAMLTPQFPAALWTVDRDSRAQGLAWRRPWLASGEEYWGHHGADPGISTVVAFRKRDRRGIVLMANSSRVHHALDGIAWHFLDGSEMA